MNPFYQNLLAAFVRKGLTALSGILVAHKFMSQSQGDSWMAAGTDYLIDSIPAALAVAWSWVTAYMNRKKILTALTLPQGSTENDVKEAIKNEVTPTVKTPSNTIPGTPDTTNK